MTLLPTFVMIFLATVSSAQGPGGLVNEGVQGPVGIVNEGGQDPGEGFLPIDPNGGGVIFTEVSPSPKPRPSRTPTSTPSPKPTTVIRTMSSIRSTSFTYLNGASDSPLGDYSINSVTFKQTGASDTLVVTNFRVTVSGGKPFATRTFTPSNSELTLSNRGDVITFFVYARISPCNMELAFTGRPQPSGSSGLSDWTSISGAKAVQKTWCPGGEFIYRDTVSSVANLEFLWVQWGTSRCGSDSPSFTIVTSLPLHAVQSWFEQSIRKVVAFSRLWWRYLLSCILVAMVLNSEMKSPSVSFWPSNKCCYIIANKVKRLDAPHGDRLVSLFSFMVGNDHPW